MEVLVYAAALDSGPDTAADNDEVESGSAIVALNRRFGWLARRLIHLLQKHK